MLSPARVTTVGTSFDEAAEKLRAEIQTLGHDPPEDLTPDVIYRFSTNGRRDDSAGWCVLYSESLIGIVGDFRNDEKTTFAFGDGVALTAAEKQRHTRQVAESRKKAEAERSRQYEAAATEALAAWEAASLAPALNSYLARKKIAACGAREDGGVLIVPVFVGDEIVSLQRIFPDGSKRFFQGGRTQGGYFPIGNENTTGAILICEGFATGATLEAATGHRIYCSFGARNLLAVSAYVRDKYPEARILICGDDDYKNMINSGAKKAEAAARFIHGKMVLPDFGKDRPDNATDFNDLMVYRGINAVTTQLDAVLAENEALPAEANVKQSVKSDQKESCRVINISENTPEENIHAIFNFIKEANDLKPVLFVSDGVSYAILKTNSGVKAIALSNDELRAILQTIMRFERSFKSGDTEAILPPVEYVKMIHSWPEKPFPVFRQIIGHVVFRPDGTLITQPGYDRQTRLYYHEETPPALKRITRNEAVMAIDHILQDFPFQTLADKSVAIALMIWLVARELIGGRSPLFLIEASIHGTGKGLLVWIAYYIVTGQEPPISTETTNDDELRKTIGASLMEGVEILFVDNINHPITQGEWSALLTSSVYTTRVLGSSRTVTMENRTTLIMTANNAELSGEIARRTVRCRQVATTSRPWERNGFAIPDLKTFVKENRSALLSAVVSLIWDWIDAGKPEWSGLSMGSFEEFSRGVGGILEVAEIPEFLENRNSIFEESDTSSLAFSEFLHAWWDVFSNSGATVANLFPIAQKTETFDLGDGSMRAQKITLGRLIGKRRDSVLDGLRISSAGTRKRAAIWKLNRSVGE